MVDEDKLIALVRENQKLRDTLDVCYRVIVSGMESARPTKKKDPNFIKQLAYETIQLRRRQERAEFRLTKLEKEHDEPAK